MDLTFQVVIAAMKLKDACSLEEKSDAVNKEQYCIGTWNVRPMNQGKLEVLKQEMASVNINILGISEIKWT